MTTPISLSDARLLLRGDAAKQSISEDEFGLSRMVDAVAAALGSRLGSSGYVIGIEGKWGSGKSTFVNFVAERLACESPNHRVIRFDPWLVGPREALLSEFFRLLASEIEALEKKGEIPMPSKAASWRARSRRLSEKVKTYGDWAGAIAVPASALASVESGHLSAVLTGITIAMKSGSALSKLLKTGAPSLASLKSEIECNLAELAKTRQDLRFCVIIDDLDRLESSEALEILRLVKKVADFPLITYIVCFDREILAEQVRGGLGAIDGNDFIEKIFQSVLTLPPQEPFALRRYLKRRLGELFPREMSDDPLVQPGQEFRRGYLFDQWAGRLLVTPRDVNRVVDAIAFGWPTISEHADFLDYAWLQLLKLKCLPLYLWTQTYLAGVGAHRDSGRPGETEPKEQADALGKIMDGLGWGPRYFISGIDQFLPGLRNFVTKKKNVFDFSRGELASFERGERLGSPSHWRHYFAFDKPSYAIGDDEIVEVRRAAADDPFRAARMLEAFATRPNDSPGHFLDVLLDRLADTPLTSMEAGGLAIALAEVMDDIARRIGRRPVGGRTEIWRKGSALLEKAAPQDILNLFEMGKSINWLASILRNYASLSDSGGDQSWIEGTNRERAVGAMLSRFRNMGLAKIFQEPEPLVILQCWRFFGDDTELHSLIAASTEDDAGFLDALNAMRSWVHSSENGTYYPVSRPVIADFIDPDQAKSRLERLTRDGSGDLWVRARELLDDFIDH